MLRLVSYKWFTESLQAVFYCQMLSLSLSLLKEKKRQKIMKLLLNHKASILTFSLCLVAVVVGMCAYEKLKSSKVFARKEDTTPVIEGLVQVEEA